MAHSCPICNNPNSSLLFIKKEIPYYSCTGCRFIFSVTDSNANLENKIADFETSYLQYFDEKKSDKKNHAKMLAWVNKIHPGNNKTLLDIGCGSGKWVNYLNGHGVTATGVEPSLSLYDHFLKGDLDFFCGTVDEFAIATNGKTFDVITAFDVLEHIKEPVPFMTTIARLMHPGSHLLMSMPDAGSFHRKITGKGWHYFNKYHYSYFTKNTLQLAAEKSGLTLLHTSHQSRYFQTSYVWDYFKNFVLQKKSAYSPSQKGFLVSLNLFDNMYCVLKVSDVSQSV